jgi:hypothetical protein
MGEHPALKNLYESVVAGTFKWDRWGLLGALSDCILSYVDGNILEIGCGESSIYFSKLAEKYNRKCFHVEFSKSGVTNMKNTTGYFGKNSIVHNVKSDKFFQDSSTNMRFALAFIDGDHLYQPVQRDFLNTLNHLVPGGFIFLHDTYPPDENWIVEHRCGTVFKLRRHLESLDEFEVFTFPFTAFDVGLTMVRRKENRSWENKHGS